jgi:hypothetical protein
MSPGIFYLVGFGPDVFADALVQPEQAMPGVPHFPTSLSPLHPRRPIGPAPSPLLAPMVIGLPHANGKPFMSGATNARSAAAF